MHHAKTLAALAAALLLSACGTVKRGEMFSLLPASTLAEDLGSSLKGYDEVPAVTGEDMMLHPETIGALIPYAEYSVRTGLSFGGNVDWMRRKGKFAGADAVVVALVGSTYAGSVSQHWGYGFMTSSAQFANDYLVYLLRVPTCTVGIEIDEHGIVTLVRGQALECGIQESDKLVVFDGKPVRGGSLQQIVRSPHLTTFLQRRPGDRVGMVWIRPGEGRMEGEVELTAFDRAGYEKAMEELRAGAGGE